MSEVKFLQKFIRRQWARTPNRRKGCAGLPAGYLAMHSEPRFDQGKTLRKTASDPARDIPFAFLSGKIKCDRGNELRVDEGIVDNRYGMTVPGASIFRDDDTNCCPPN